MFDTSPDNLWQEVREADRKRDEALDGTDDAIRRLMGQEDYESDAYEPENHAYEYLALVTSKVVFDNPKAMIRSKLGGVGRDAAEGIQFAVNRWARDQRLREKLQRVWFDSVFAFGGGMVTNVPRPGFSYRDANSPRWPAFYRQSPDRIGADPQAHGFDEARFTYIRFERDRHAILAEQEQDADAGWDVRAIRGLEGSAPQDSTSLVNEEERSDRRQREDQISGYEIWVPEAEDDVPDHPGETKGYHGTIYTIAHGHDARDGKRKIMWIRRPRPFFGPSWGPVIFCGIYTAPNRIWPFGPLRATRGQQRELNDHLRAMGRSAREYKKLVLVNDMNQDLVEKLQSEPHNFVVPVKGLSDDQVVSFEIGGLTSQLLDHARILHDRLDRNSGMTESKRGQTRSRVTASAELIADAASESRIAFVQQQFRDFARRVMTTAAWYMWNDDRVEVPLGEEASSQIFRRLRRTALRNPMLAAGIQAMEMRGGKLEENFGHTFVGGGETGLRFDDLDIEIEPTSMPRTDDPIEQSKAIQKATLVGQLAPLVVQFPFVRWQDVFDDLGDSLNDPDFARVIDMEMAQQIAKMQIAAGLSNEGPRLPQYGPSKVGQRSKPQSQSSGPSLAGPSIGDSAAIGGTMNGRTPGQGAASLNGTIQGANSER